MDVVTPGSRLVSRYLLEEHLGGPGVHGEDAGTDPGEAAGVTTTGSGQVKGATYWRALDELLDRPVSVCLLQAGSSYADRVLAAARQAAVLTDARFLRILDAAEVDGLVYVVSEWVPARTLADQLTEGPLSAPEARVLAQEVTAALGAAHDAGLDHLVLHPEHVLRTPHGQVKLAGLAVDAAARGIRVEDPAEAARRDATGAACVLYAALTARWPGDEPTALPPAPRDGDVLCSPRQVRAGVPDDLEDLVCRVLDLPGRHGGPPLRSVEEMAAVLESSPVTSRIALPVVPRGTEGSPDPGGPDYDDGPPPRRSSAAVAGWVLAGMVLLLGAGLALTQLVGELGGTPASGPGGDAAASDGPRGEVRPLEVSKVTGFDPPPAGNAEENSDRAGNAVDGNPRTAWTTKDYYDPFGPVGLKSGVGLLLDLGGAHDVSQLTVLLRGGPTSLELRVADTRSDRLEDYRVVDEVRGADGRAVVRPADAVSARYVLVWLTDVPSVGGRYRGTVAEVTLRGAAAS